MFTVGKGRHRLRCTTTLIGRTEAQLAFLNLLGDGAATGAVDVTDEVGFAWPRFLQNQFQRLKMVGPGITKVLVVRFVRDGNPSMVICRTDDTYVVLKARAIDQRSDTTR